MARAGRTRKPAFIINEYDPVRTVWTPLPHDEVEIPCARSGGETPDSHACMARRHQPVGQGLRRRGRACKHLGFPSGAYQVGKIDAQSPALIFIQRINDRLSINLIGAQGERLHRSAEWLRLAYGGQRGEGGIERRDAASVETAAVAASPLA